MQFTDEHVFDEPLATIEKMYFDPGFVPKKYEVLGYTGIEVLEQKSDGNDFSVRCKFEMIPTIQIPKFAQKFIRADQPVPVIQTDRWNTETNRGELIIELSSLPGMTLQCDMHLTEHPCGTVNKMSWTVESSIPLIGKKLAQLMADDIKGKSAVDLQASMKLLPEYK